ncbi:MAG: hypothetical protein LBK73_13475 [Treponema sp.]|nr:hypothetical protein [Treponema sp.]
MQLAAMMDPHTAVELSLDGIVRVVGWVYRSPWGMAVAETQVKPMYEYISSYLPLWQFFFSIGIFPDFVSSRLHPTLWVIFMPVQQGFFDPLQKFHNWL